MVVVIDNFDYEYWLFRRSAELGTASAQPAVLIPTPVNGDGELAIAGKEVVDSFARVAHLEHWEIVPIREREPISLNTAYQVRDFLVRQQVTSITLVSSAFRSRRSELVYRKILEERGIALDCVPVRGSATPENWTQTWHGIQEVALQLMKLQYYRLWVMPFLDRRAPAPATSSVDTLNLIR